MINNYQAGRGENGLQRRSYSSSIAASLNKGTTVEMHISLFFFLTSLLFIQIYLLLKMSLCSHKYQNLSK